MPKCIVIKKEAVKRGGVLYKDDVTICRMTEQEIKWFLDKQVPGDNDIVIIAKGVKSKL